MPEGNWTNQGLQLIFRFCFSEFRQEPLHTVSGSGVAAMTNALSSALLIRRDQYLASDLLDRPPLLIVDFQFQGSTRSA
jgi:hypothetical protein